MEKKKERRKHWLSSENIIYWAIGNMFPLNKTFEREEKYQLILFFECFANAEMIYTNVVCLIRGFCGREYFQNYGHLYTT